jgi:hypothetical protein
MSTFLAERLLKMFSCFRIDIVFIRRLVGHIVSEFSKFKGARDGLISQVYSKLAHSIFAHWVKIE